MDLAPFLRINPCGYAGMEMTQMRQWVATATPDTIRPVLLKNLLALLNNPRTNISLLNISYNSAFDGPLLFTAFTLYNNPHFYIFEAPEY
jgi:hypothetical protein